MITSLLKDHYFGFRQRATSPDAEIGVEAVILRDPLEASTLIGGPCAAKESLAAVSLGDLLVPAARPITGPGVSPFPSAPATRAGRTSSTDLQRYLVAKRLLDLFVAITGLFILLPVLALVALAVRLDSPGPMLYRQRRLGEHGREIFMLKFRSMRPDRRADRRAPLEERRRTLKSDRDPRVTRLGRFLRKTSLDELPQLLNILRGDMSLVGPRPEQVEMVAHYGLEHYQRHLAKPGLTGWWQVHGRVRRSRGIDPHEDLKIKLADDLYYLRHRSLILDLRILFLTIPVALFGRGAY